MDKVRILHNNRCSKSREAFNWMEENVNDFETVNYLNDIPTKKELKSILKKLGMSASEIIRKSEPDYKTNFKGKNLSEDEWIDAMVKFPKLIERPIVVKGDKAAIGRPLENVINLLK